MAEFLGQKKHEKSKLGKDSGFNAMGKPIPAIRRLSADTNLQQMGVSDREERFVCIQNVAQRLERDDPYGAVQEAMRYVDLTGAYRLVAALLTGPADEFCDAKSLVDDLWCNRKSGHDGNHNYVRTKNVEA